MVQITTYYTDTRYRPVISIAEASKTGHATNVIAGVAVGLESTALPVIVVVIAILSSYWLGESSGIKSNTSIGAATAAANATGRVPVAGLFGTAVATMGMLSTAVYVLAMDFFGPIADNAGGIVEMSGEPERVRRVTDLLDAVGNTTKASTKGFAVGSAALACFLLFAAFMDEVQQITVSAGKGASAAFDTLDVTRPEVFAAGLLGAMMVFLFSSMTMTAVGVTAQAVVAEVRRQFREDPGIMQGTSRPNYKACVTIVAKAALWMMIKPGALAVLSPVVIGLAFRWIGSARNNPTLGAEAVLSVLVFSTVSGLLLSLFFNNAGGAWDNAKKLVETGEQRYGGKGSEAHKASVTGDTVGDPFKDTAGPSLHCVIKLVSTVALVTAPLFVSDA